MTGHTPQLPLSVEQAYRQKCIDLKKRLSECEDSNELLVVRNQRLKRGIQRLRLERALLLREIEERIEPRVDDSDGTPSPPPTPNEKPLRTKRPRREPPQNGQSERQESPPSPSAGEPLPFLSNFRSVNNATPIEAASSPPPAPARWTASRPPVGGRSGNARESNKSKPKNAYMIFCDEKRDSYKAIDENESDVALELARAWQALSTEGQALYFQQAQALRSEYDRENPRSQNANSRVKSPSRAESTPVADTTENLTEDELPHRAEREYDNDTGAGSGFTAVNANRSNFL